MHAVRGVDLDIVPGETVALLGPNGAGKSTTIDLILGLGRPDHGQVSVFGLEPAQAVARGLVAGMLQTGQLIRDLDVRELVALVASLYPNPLDVDEVVWLTGADAFAGQRTHKLSGGQAQRVRFANALVAKADLEAFGPFSARPWPPAGCRNMAAGRDGGGIRVSLPVCPWSSTERIHLRLRYAPASGSTPACTGGPDRAENGRGRSGRVEGASDAATTGFWARRRLTAGAGAARTGGSGAPNRHRFGRTGRLTMSGRPAGGLVTASTVLGPAAAPVGPARANRHRQRPRGWCPRVG